MLMYLAVLDFIFKEDTHLPPVDSLTLRLLPFLPRAPFRDPELPPGASQGADGLQWRGQPLNQGQVLTVCLSLADYWDHSTDA